MKYTIFLLIRNAHKFYFKIDSELVLKWTTILVDFDDGTKPNSSSSFPPSRHTRIRTDPGVTLSIRSTLRLSAIFFQTSAFIPAISEVSNRRIKYN